MPCDHDIYITVREQLTVQSAHMCGGMVVASTECSHLDSLNCTHTTRIVEQSFTFNGANLIFPIKCIAINTSGQFALMSAIETFAYPTVCAHSITTMSTLSLSTLSSIFPMTTSPKSDIFPKHSIVNFTKILFSTASDSFKARYSTALPESNIFSEHTTINIQISTSSDTFKATYSTQPSMLSKHIKIPH